MSTKTIKVNVEVPEGISEENKDAATQQAHEAAVLALWLAGAVSTRAAAAELGLTYYDYLDLLAARGLPAENAGFDLEALERARRKLTEGKV